MRLSLSAFLVILAVLVMAWFAFGVYGVAVFVWVFAMLAFIS